LLIIVMIGLRYKVGADWDEYSTIYLRTGPLELPEALKLGDPAYQLLNWVCYQAGLGIWAVNLICAAIFGWGLYRFCQVQSLPWVAAAVAIPYMVIVFAMAYTRQGVALGILLAGLSKQIRGASILNFAFYTLIAAAFHKTAVMMFPIIAITSRGSNIVNFFIIFFFSILLYDSFLGNSMDSFIQNYLGTKYASQGALIRIAMTSAAAGILLTNKQKLQFDSFEWKTWRNFSLCSLGTLACYPFFSSSTALDRVSLYLMPLQLAVFSRLGATSRNKTVTVLVILVYMAMVEGVWLLFAEHSRYWIPYRIYPI
jgi:hypothetical protein